MDIKIEPLPGIVFIELDKVEAGDMDFSNRPGAVEVATVKEVGSDMPFGQIKIGDRIFVKSWAIDTINHEGKTYCFINLETKGILAKFT